MDTRALWLLIAGAAWALAWAGSFAAFAMSEPAGEGFVRGLNRITGFLGWQGVAAMLAFAVWGAGRGWPARHPVRRASLIPLARAAVLAVGLLAVVLWARFAA